ncbi:uncharacterized protein [Leptinotarsa decemlineata]|uniref:uncharacterized protein n=1 Tax=Leptinotarsa decemlineata TaxID=7539 RepID=UPI003D308B81
MLSTEELIESVRVKPILYDLTNSEYKNIKKKDKIWDEIAESFEGVTGEEIKKKWKNLRDSYSKYLRTEKTTTGQETKILDRYKTWPWAQQMEFLRPSLAFAKTHSNVMSVRQPPSSELTEEGHNQVQCQETADKNDPSVESQTPSESTQSLSDMQQTNTNRQPIGTNQPPAKKNKKHEFSKAPATQLSQRQNQPAKHQSSSSSVEQVISYFDRKTAESACDDIDDIFKGYVKTVKKISKRRQVIIKFKISQLLMEQELEHLDEEERRRSTNSYVFPQPEAYSNPVVHISENSSSLDRPGSSESNFHDSEFSVDWYERFGTSLTKFPSNI